MRIDLHCHSTWSDGTELCARVAERALRRDVELFCLTDHDTCQGSEVASSTFGAGALRGVELSCREEGRTVHLLVYDVGRDQRWQRLEARLTELADGRRERARAMGDRLAEAGAAIDIDAVITSARGTVGRPHLARALVAAGHVRNLGEAFDRFLGDGGPCDVPIERLSVADALVLAGEAGGVVSLAHPHTLGELSARICERHRAAGLEAIEAYYGFYGNRERKRWLALAAKLDLVVTGGSDYHGGEPPAAPRLGVDLPDDHAARLRDWLGV